jgi:hypothetical protein
MQDKTTLNFLICQGEEQKAKGVPGLRSAALEERPARRDLRQEAKSAEGR